MNASQPTAADESLCDEIVAADDARITALLERDRHSLDALLSEQLIYVHSSGREETKDVYVERVVNATYDYRSITVTRRHIRVLNDVAIVNADNDIDMVVGGNLREIAGRYLMVWKNEGGRWRLYRFHGSPVARSGAGA